MILVLVGLKRDPVSPVTDTHAALAGSGSSSAPSEPLVNGINGVLACFSSTSTRFQFCEDINASVYGLQAELRKFQSDLKLWLGPKDDSDK